MNRPTHWFLTLIPLLLTTAAFAEPATSSFPADYAQLLQTYATPAGVRYAAWHKNPEDIKRLKAVTDFYATTPPPTDAKESLAWHTNAYNASILAEILSKYPTKGPLDGTPNFFETPRVQISGKKISFNDLEQKLIRPVFKEPRVHFALNCASKSCPPLLPTPFVGSTIEADMDRLATAFINTNPQGVQPGPKSVRVSKIFEWYADDFGGKGQALNFINRFREPKLPANSKVEFMEYDWALNAVE